MRKAYVNEYFQLDDRVVDELERRKPEFGYNGFGEFIFYRTYSRQQRNGKQETWADVVVRVINGVMSIRKDHYIRNRIEWDDRRWQDYSAEMALSMFDMKWLPPGRGLWAMGTAFVVERGSMALYNCFSGLTRFLDGHNLVCLKDKVGERVDVLCSDGKYREATVRHFGKRKVNTIRFKPSNGKGKYYITHHATSDHRWILSDGTVTPYLREGDKVLISPGKIDKDNQEYRNGFVHGLIFADGCQHNKYPTRYMIRLCGWKNKYREMLVGHPDFRTECKAEDDAYVTLVSDTEFKSCPTTQTLSYKQGFFDAWQKMDGYGTRHLDTTDFAASQWLEHYSGILEYVLVGRSENDSDTNYGKRTRPLIRYTFNRSAVEFKVWDIFCDTPAEDVYCVVEPETESFMLSHGVITKNCAATKLGSNDRFANDCHWLMDALMLGVGVGFEALRDDLRTSRPEGKFRYEIPDTREGWCDSVKLLIEAYTQPGRYEPEFDYSGIRKKGEPIRGFGGQASGPGPLIQLHDDIRRLCTTSNLSPLRLKTDIANKIGVCVVAGNVRRSAELAKGDIKDREFMDLKDYDRYPEREDFGWMSNNTVALNDDEDFERLGEVARRVIQRGEPGLMNLRNMRLGRVGRDMKGLREDNADLLNPCGEIPLEDKETCNISETLPTRCNNDGEWLRACEFASFYSSTVSLLPTHRPETNAVIARNRRIGVGIVDITGWIHDSSMNRVIKLMRKGYEVVRSTNKLANGEAGVPEAIRVTTVKPGGTVPKVAGRTSGAGYPTFEETMFNIRVASNAPVVKILRKGKLPWEPEVFDPENTLVFKWPVKQGPSQPAEKVSLWQQAMLLTMIQREWADNAVSNTLYFRPKWVLKTHVTKKAEAKRLLRGRVRSKEFEDAYSRISELRGKTTLLETKTDKYVLFYEKWPMNGGDTVQLKHYRFDPTHEEDIIEPVLSSIAPLIKSCSLLPHAAKGVYRQMPQEGITPEEYAEAVAKLGKFDWTNFEGEETPDAESEKYCSGESCSIMPR